MKKTYFKLKDKNEHFRDIMEKNQQEIDAMNVKIQNLEEVSKKKNVFWSIIIPILWNN